MYNVTQPRHQRRKCLIQKSKKMYETEVIVPHVLRHCAMTRSRDPRAVVGRNAMCVPFLSRTSTIQSETHTYTDSPPTMQPHMSLHSVLSSPNLSTISSRSNSISPTEVTGIAARQFYMPVHSDQTNPSQSSQGPGFHTRLDTGNQIFQGNQTRQSTPGFMGSGFLSAGGPSVMNRSQSPISVRVHACRQ